MKKKLTPAITEGFYYDEAKHLYYFDGKPMTGCTTILNVISKPALVGWAARMAVEYIKAHGEKKFEEANVWTVDEEDLENAQKAHAQKRDKAADEGTQLHALVEGYVNECLRDYNGLPVPAATGKYEKIQKFVQWANLENIRFISSERKLYSKELFVAGTADLIFEKDGRVFIGDLKCKDKIWSREPMLQCAGYGIMYQEMTGLGIYGYCVIRLKGDDFETLWSYDTEGDTKGFRAAVELYRCMANFVPTKTTWKN